MAKHGKDKRFDKTGGNPVIRALKAQDKVNYRVAKDVLILTQGWNATEEARDFANMTREQYIEKYHSGGGKHRG